MKKSILISTIMVVVVAILGGCTPKKVEETTEFALTITNNSELSFDNLNYEYAIDGNTIGGGGVNPADGTAFKKGEEIYVDFIPEFFPEDADLSKFSMTFFIMQGDKELKTNIKIDAKYGEYYKYNLSNTSDTEFTLEKE